ncbi:MAG: HAMP domain-containing histidine kinase [Deltaproteobacteria bacterium]|nr:HAMP domain-containing histidine kinase [Deltaproteobacteria bacterium]
MKDRARGLVAVLALVTIAAVAMTSTQIALDAPWAALICLIVAAVALFWPETAPRDADLLRQVASALSDVKSPEALGAKLRAVLQHHFHNAYVIAVDHTSNPPQLHCLHEVLPPTEGAPLPARFAGRELAPVAQLLEQRVPLARSDFDDGTMDNGMADPRSSHRFWHTYGLASLWPAQATEEEPLRGLVALGAPLGTPPSNDTLLAITQLFASGLTLLGGREDLAGHQRVLQQSVTQAHQSLSLALDDLEEARAKLVEAEKQAMIGRLAAGIVHEVNSPLGTLKSAADTLERATTRVKELMEASAERIDGAVLQRAHRAFGAQDTALQVMHEGHARLNEVIERIGRFANLDSAEIKNVDLRTCIEDAVALVQAQSSAEQIEFSLDLPMSALEITCFPAKLNHAFFNLVENAAAAIEQSGVVTICVSRREGTKGLPATAQVEITDTGQGIPHEKLPGLLDLAFTVRLGGRVGLRTGLPATRQTFVELGGDLIIESELAKGTRAVATLPLTSH